MNEVFKFKTATSVEQSKKLLKLGLSPETADLCWKRVAQYDENWNPVMVLYSKKRVEECMLLYEFPAWSLSALMNLMPSVQLDKFSPVYSLEYNYIHSHYTDDYTDPVDAAVEMVEWMLKKEVIK